MTSIAPVTNASEREEFITFPWKVYAGDQNWVPPLLSERRRFVDPDKNPFFEHAKAQFFVARRNGEVVGTIAAFTNHLYNETHDDKSGFFGFFEVLDEPETAALLLQSGEDWLRGEGHENVLGPMQYSTNEELGMLVDGFDSPPCVLMTYNPKRYIDYLSSAGYEKAMDLWAYAMAMDELLNSLPDKVYRLQEKILKRWNLTVRKMARADFHEEVRRVLRVYNASWAANWGAVPLTDNEVALAAENLRSIIDPDLTVMVEQEGAPVAMGIVLPDLHEPLRLAYPRPGFPEPITLLKLWWHWKVRKSIKWVRGWAMGVVPEFQGRGLNSLLLSRMIESSHAKGYEMAEIGWVLETNERIQRDMSLLGVEVYKTYRIFQKRL